PVSLPEEEEEELQMKSLDNSTLQRESLPEEEEEELQMKSLDNSTLQRESLPEEEEEEEELQMKSLDNSTLQRESLPEEEEELQMKPMVQRQAKGGMAANPDLEASINQARGGGQPIADNIREPMEQAFGADFSGVKVHIDSQSDELNQSIQARAFTTGQDVFFRQGEYNPGSRGGQELLAHELTHVVQQNGGMVERSLFANETPSASLSDGGMQAKGGMNSVSRMLLQPIARPTSYCAQQVIQRQAELGSIQIEMSGTVISNSHISTNDRPEGAMKGEEGSHTTAWIVTVEGIRQSIQGKTIDQAIGVINNLYKLAQELPGVDRVKALSKERREHLDTIKDKVDTNKKAAKTAPSLDTLQEYISGLMAYRNALPLSAAKRGALADSGAEANSIAKLRNYQAETPAALRAAIFKLLDKKAVADFQSNAEFEEDQDEDMLEVSIDNPGSYNDDDDQNARVIDIITQHLEWVKGLFPAAYVKAGISNDHILDEFLFSSGGDFGYREDFEDNVNAPDLPKNTPIPAPIPANDRFSTQVVLDDTDHNKVAALIVTGRPQGVFGGQDRKHTTAWAVFVRGATRKTEGQTLAQAVTGIKSLLTDAKAMPGAEDTQVNAMSDQGTGRVKAALVTADTAQLAADTAIRSGNLQAKQNALQVFVHAYLAYRNALPLSAALISSELSTSGGKAEPKNLATLDSFENGARLRTEKEKNSAVESFWKLFDLGTLKVLTDDRYSPPTINTANVSYKADMPGVATATNKPTRILNILAQHILTMKSAYPNTTDRIQTELSTSLNNILGKVFKNERRIKTVANTIRQKVGWPSRK
ncbi:DUF4157 domain-containing protein, partial [Desmonostoc muscorum CCALA 125]|nr:DUF4157 domain-containing protein [Desmonostoc muscorum CCALA 125]